MKKNTQYASDIANSYWHEMTENWNLKPKEVMRIAVLYSFWKNLAVKLYTKTKGDLK